MTRTYEFWLALLKSWGVRRRQSIEAWTVQYGDNAALSQSQGDEASWADRTASRRTLCTRTTIPWDGAVFHATVSGETLLSLNSIPAYGLNPYHDRFFPELPEGTVVNLTLEQVTTGLMGVLVPHPAIHEISWWDIDRVAESSYWDLAVLLEWGDDPDTPVDLVRWLKRALDHVLTPFYALAPDLEAIQQYTYRSHRDAEEEGLFQALASLPIKGLQNVSASARHQLLESLSTALAQIYDDLGQRAPRGNGELLMMGHAHIDLAWLWPISETHRKVVRTAASQAHLLSRYPDWRFGMSSPEMWQIIEDYPSLWHTWQQLVDAGRVEPLGAFWVESDGQLIGGESVLRHLLYGLRYFIKTVGKRLTTAFLPDTFGFAGGLPTLLHAAGIRLFLTTKINWNDTNPFPYKNFRWTGPDGSVIDAMLFGNSPDGYNGKASIRDLKMAWERFRDGGGENRVLYAFGHGDGGGGPDASMLERIRRYQRLPLLPHLIDASLDQLETPPEDRTTLPVYRGDLYLEYHRGVFTSQSAVKSANRIIERLLVSTEAWALLAGLPAPISEAWQRFLRNHFHDILPGSSIHQVYEDFDQDMVLIRNQLEPLQRAAIGALVSHHGNHPTLIIGHPSRFHRPSGMFVMRRARSFQVFWEEAWHDAVPAGPGQFAVPLPALPALSVTTWPLREKNGAAESFTPIAGLPHYHWSCGALVIDVVPEGIRTLIHQGRPLLDSPAGLTAFYQHPTQFDAWELVPPEQRGVVPLTSDPIRLDWEGEHWAHLTLTHHVGATTIVEQIVLNGPEQRIELGLTMVIGDRHLVIQYRVPTTLVSQFVTRETLWGADTLPTIPSGPVDAARFEWVAHRFIDLSEPHHGLALVNDGRYGHAVNNRVMTVTLVTTPLFPDPAADQQPSPVHLALIPHRGSWYEANIMARAHAFTETAWVDEQLTDRDVCTRHAPLTGLPSNIALLTVKSAEDGSGDWIYHLGEMWGDRTEFVVKWPIPVVQVSRIDLVEETSEERLSGDQGHTRLVMTAYQLLVIRISRAQPEGAGV